MAEVRDGWDTRLDRPVAVKLLYPVFSMQPDNRRRFEIEARAAAGLNHPHIVAVHDSGEHDGTPYIVMERLSERTLSDLIAEGPLPQPQVRSILDDVLSALAAAHAAGILHRDIKPGNILFSALGRHEARRLRHREERRNTAHDDGSDRRHDGLPQSPTGSPEDPRRVADDLYAVGASAMRRWPAAGRSRRRTWPNWPAPSPRTGPFRWPCCAPTWIPVLDTVVNRAMAREPQWRFGSAAAMRAELAGRAPAGARPPTMVLASPLPDPATMLVPPAARRSRSRKMLGLAAALVAIVIAAAAFIADTTSRAPAPQPASTSTPVPPPLTTSVAPPLTSAPPPPTEVDEGPPGQRKGNRGENGKGPKPKED